MEFESGRCSALTSADLSWASHFPLVLNSTGGNFTRKFLLLRDIGLARAEKDITQAYIEVMYEADLVDTAV
uniref:Uncharacterized protein n=1 Tax=Aegilops tauschii TaxID=37682 RepID=M8CH53_AEGTA